MPNVTAETPRTDAKIAFVNFKVPAPYSAGHTIDADEANALNGAYASRLSALCSADIKERFGAEKTKGDNQEVVWAEGWNAERAQNEIVDAYVSNFSWYTSTGGDPVLAEMKAIARKAVDRAMKDQGVELDKPTYNAKVSEILNKQDKQLRKLAEKNLAAIPQIDLTVEAA